MYLYPNDLKSKPVLWFWYMKDVVIIGIATLLSVYLYMRFEVLLCLVFVALYAIVTLRLGDVSILDLLMYSITFFILQSQEFHWYKESEFINKEKI